MVGWWLIDRYTDDPLPMNYVIAVGDRVADILVSINANE